MLAISGGIFSAAGNHRAAALVGAIEKDWCRLQSILPVCNRSETAQNEYNVLLSRIIGNCLSSRFISGEVKEVPSTETVTYSGEGFIGIVKGLECHRLLLVWGDRKHPVYFDDSSQRCLSRVVLRNPGGCSTVLGIGAPSSRFFSEGAHYGLVNALREALSQQGVIFI